MSVQVQIDFSPTTTTVSLTVPFNRGKQNNEDYQENRLHFAGQAKKVLDILLEGKSVSSFEMMKQFNIVDTRARIYNIQKVLDIEIPETKIPRGHGAKEWKLTQEQIVEIKNKLE